MGVATTSYDLDYSDLEYLVMCSVFSSFIYFSYLILLLALAISVATAKPIQFEKIDIELQIKNLKF